MKTQEIKVTFQPSGRTVYVLPGTRMLEAAGRAGIILQTPCGGQGTCGKCRVRVVSGEFTAQNGHAGNISARQVKQGHCLACQATILSAAVIDVPPESMFEHQQQILEFDTGERGGLNPAFSKIFFELPPPSITDTRADLARLRDAVGAVHMAPEFVKMIPGFLRRNGWKGTAVLSDGVLMGLEPGNTARRMFGTAFDIGTTTVVGTLFDLSDGRELAVSSRLNPQIAHGDDVISRIMRVRADAAALDELQDLIIGAVNQIIVAMAQHAGVAVQEIYDITLAGNSTMQQLLCGYDPSALGEVPFIQAFDRAQVISASRLGINANLGAQVYVFSQIGSFVGGDTVSGMLASRLDKWDKPVLLVDIGTNGEIVLAANGQMRATSAAAGPAFEGARITNGMRATAGAIDKVLFKDDVVLNVIGDVKPVGLCGTAVIDAVAELLRTEILDSTGRIQSAGDVPARLPAALRRRLVTAANGETNFLLADAAETGTGEPVYLWQKDVREVQLATGAIRAAIQILLQRSGVAAEDLDAVLLAGAFGNFIRRNNARRIGLLPMIPCKRIRFIGNAASLGAKMALLSSDERRYAEKLAAACEHVDLSLDPEFQNEFAMAMMFPDTSLDHCE